MALALGCSLLASVVCLLGADGPWRARVHHLLPTPLMALGMGHAGLPSGLLTAVAAAGCLWALGVALARRARELRTTLHADAVDAFAMAAALVVWSLTRAACAVPTAGAAPATAPDSFVHAGHAAGAVLSGEGGGLAWPVVAAAVLVGAVLSTRVAGDCGRLGLRVVRSVLPALLMAGSIVAMLLG